MGRSVMDDGDFGVLEMLSKVFSSDEPLLINLSHIRGTCNKGALCVDRIRRCRRDFSAFEIGGADFRIGEPLLAGGRSSSPQRSECVLLDEEHGEPFLFVELADRLEDALDDQWREAERGFVEKQQLRARHQRAVTC